MFIPIAKAWTCTVWTHPVTGVTSTECGVDESSAVTLVTGATGNLSDTLTSILPVAIPTLIVVGLLFWAIRKFVHNG